MYYVKLLIGLLIAISLNTLPTIYSDIYGVLLLFTILLILVGGGVPVGLTPTRMQLGASWLASVLGFIIVAGLSTILTIAYGIIVILVLVMIIREIMA